MAYTTPKTWTAAVLAVADMNTHVRDNIAYLKANLHPDAAALLTVASGAVTATQTCHKIEGEGTTDDELNTISGGAEGKIIILRANSASVITLKNGTGNLVLGRDITLSTTNMVVLISNGTNWYPLFAPSRTRHVTSGVFDLSGSAATEVLLHPSAGVSLSKFLIVYQEASSADAGVALKLGKESDDDYFYTGTSETEKAQWYELDATLLQNALDAGDSLIASCAGGKAGTGNVIICVEYTNDD